MVGVVRVIQLVLWKKLGTEIDMIQASPMDGSWLFYNLLKTHVPEHDWQPVRWFFQVIKVHVSTNHRLLVGGDIVLYNFHKLVKILVRLSIRRAIQIEDVEVNEAQFKSLDIIFVDSLHLFIVHEGSDGQGESGNDDYAQANKICDTILQLSWLERAINWCTTI